MAKEPGSVRFSARTEWYFKELIRLGVGKTRSEIVRRFVWDGIVDYIVVKKLLPAEVASLADLPPAEDPEDGEP